MHYPCPGIIIASPRRCRQKCHQSPFAPSAVVRISRRRFLRMRQMETNMQGNSGAFTSFRDGDGVANRKFLHRPTGRKSCLHTYINCINCDVVAIPHHADDGREVPRGAYGPALSVTAAAKGGDGTLFPEKRSRRPHAQTTQWFHVPHSTHALN